MYSILRNRRNSFLILFLIFFLFFSGCKNSNKSESGKELKKNCNKFIPPWGDENWESWGKNHGTEFELWYGEIMPKMAKVTEKDISECSHIENMFIGFTKIKTLKVFSKMTNLRKLDMRFAGNIKELSPLKNLKNLEYLNIWKTEVTDLSPISELPKLKIIDAKMTPLVDISALKNLKTLESIDLLQTKVKDIKVFSNLKNLKEVLLCSTKVDDISSIYFIAEQITYIDLCNTAFTDFKSLKKFKNLERLKLWGLPVTDASLFSGMENLYELDLWNTEITDLSPIFKLKKLKRVVLVGLNIKPNQIETIRKNNPGIEIVTEL